MDVEEPRTLAVVAAVRAGDLAELDRLLTEYPDLIGARIEGRSLLHVATDWPGHLPHVGGTIATLVAHGAEVDARFVGAHTETPLHWAASNDDVEALDALLDAGADIEAEGAVIGGGTPLADAVAFAQWNTARRLVERGASVQAHQAAALGLLDRMTEPFDLDLAFWYAAHGGQRELAAYLLERGADPSWLPGWEPVDAEGAARRNGFGELADWLSRRS
ncbi:ankyrin repeat domain-containing protein [Nonomuraea dietziae]|uniref:Ankyrin repeat protein n=1 Tax=Nonomuraea dietziae TaxID=65515 RepID=A0A7W5YSB6_9ACTN|nr:ankyrin repeat domain-containing protein [Nonomuraea dietziae]MBB3728814.1 ankyrin repeat protein [Nonomuraea dietziae]